MPQSNKPSIFTFGNKLGKTKAKTKKIEKGQKTFCSAFHRCSS